MYSFNLELYSRCEPVCTSPDRSTTGGNQRCRYSGMLTNSLGSCQFCCSLPHVKKQKVSVSPAVMLQCDGLSCSLSLSHPYVFLGYTAPISVIPVKQTHSMDQSLFLWTLKIIFTTSEFKLRGNILKPPKFILQK